MAQKLKPAVRERILAAAERAFARGGYRPTTMGQIADEAGLSAGNLYRYFPGKEALFHAVVDDDFVARFDALLERRVRALSHLDRVDDGRAAVDDAAGEMLGFWIAHRWQVVILLDRAAGSQRDGFGDRFVQRLVHMTLEHLAARHGDVLPPVVPFTLENIFETSRRAIVRILERSTSEDEIRDAFEAFWSFQLAGLAGFEEWLLR